MKKILIVTPSLENGGTTSVLKNILSSIDRNECYIEVFPITNSGPNYDYISQYATILGTVVDNSSKKHFIISKQRIKSAIFNFVKLVKKTLCVLGLDISPVLFKRVVLKLEKRGYDEVIAFQEGQATRFCKYFKNTRKIAWVHCDYSKIEKKSQEVDIRQHLYDGFSTIVCVSEYTRQMFTNIVPNTIKKTVGIHNIIYSELLKQESLLNLDDSIFYNYNHLRLVSIGRLHPVKRFYAIPKIALDLKLKGIEFCWYIIGGDAGDLSNIVSNIEKFGVSDCVKVLGNRNNPYPYIRIADLLVCTSFSEACPNVLNEAKILGTPIVSTDFGSASEMLVDGQEGIIVPIERISDSIFSLLTNKRLYSKIKARLALFEYDNREIILKVEQVTSLRFRRN